LKLKKETTDELTDELIDGAVNNITGYIIAKAAEQYKIPLARMTELFLNSNTYKLLSDKDTGLYWDSIAETWEMFVSELAAASVRV
jgi:hypothetical protein